MSSNCPDIPHGWASYGVELFPYREYSARGCWYCKRIWRYYGSAREEVLNQIRKEKNNENL